MIERNRILGMKKERLKKGAREQSRKSQSSQQVVNKFGSVVIFGDDFRGNFSLFVFFL